MSNINEATLENIIYIETPLFKVPPCTTTFDVKNPYETEGVFKIILHEKKVIFVIIYQYNFKFINVFVKN